MSSTFITSALIETLRSMKFVLLGESPKCNLPKFSIEKNVHKMPKILSIRKGKH